MPGTLGAPGPAGPPPWTIPIPWTSGLTCTAVYPATSVTYNDGLYVCTTSHISGSVFDVTKWQLIISTSTSSATSAAASATAAATSATAAAGSATSASTSATAAAAAATTATNVASSTYKLDVLTVSGTNTVSNLSNSYSGAYAIVFVNGVAFPSNAPSPAFSISGTVLTWLSTSTTLSPATSQVAVLYSTVAPPSSNAAAFLALLAGCLQSLPTTPPSTVGAPWNNNGMIQLSQTAATALTNLTTSIAAEVTRAEAAEALISNQSSFNFAYSYIQARGS